MERTPCGSRCGPACQAADAELHGSRTFGPPSTSTPATSSSSTEQPAQLDLDGGAVPTGPRPDPTGGRFTGPGSGQQQALPVTVPRSYRSKAWGGTVVESPLDLEPIIEAAKQADRIKDWRG